METLTRPVSRLSRRGTMKAGGLLAAASGAAALGCAIPGGGTEKPASTNGPTVAKVLTFNNIIFQAPKDQLLAALAEADPKLQPDIIVFPGQINQFRERRWPCTPAATCQTRSGCTRPSPP